MDIFDKTMPKGFQEYQDDAPKPKRKPKPKGPVCFHCGEEIDGPIVYKGPNRFHKNCPRHAGKGGPTNNG